MSIIASNCQHCDEQQFQTLSCVHYVHDFLRIKVRFIHTSTVTGSHSCFRKKYAYASHRSCYNKGFTLAENIRYLMYTYDITINDWHQSLNYVIKKSSHMTMTVPIVMIHVLQVLLESHVTIKILIIIQQI